MRIDNPINYGGMLGEVKLFALSVTNAITKVTLQTEGWAICDGTTPAVQGVTNPTITTTPDLQSKFMKMSGDESSGTTGGAIAHTHGVANLNLKVVSSGSGANVVDIAAGTTDTGGGGHEPPFYEVVYFIKVR